jgi:hypothetical protein
VIYTCVCLDGWIVEGGVGSGAEAAGGARYGHV